MKYGYLTIYIIRVTLNNESDPFSLCPQHAEMAESELVTLVCPFDIWSGQGFYVDLFLIDAFPSEYQSKYKRVFSRCFQLKDIQLAVLLRIFRGHKIFSSFYK